MFAVTHSTYRWGLKVLYNPQTDVTTLAFFLTLEDKLLFILIVLCLLIVMSDSSSEEDYDSQHEMLDGQGQNSLFHFLCFTKDGDEQSSLPDLGEDRDTIGQSANSVSNLAAHDSVMLQLGKIQSSLSSMESRVKALEELSAENSGSCWADRCRSPSPSCQVRNWDEMNDALSNPAKLSEHSKSAVVVFFHKEAGFSVQIYSCKEESQGYRWLPASFYT
uniref:Uncharacterized protein n=1 Tax=Amphimedon queenslandica TaxID=400682 RepID=A0A1X7TBP5_AMPQE